MSRQRILTIPTVCFALLWGLMLFPHVLLVQSVWSQGLDLANRPVREVRFEGLKQVPEKLVSNQVRVAAGDPYDAKVVADDIIRITHLGRFSSVQARVEPMDDGSLVLVYVMVEQPLLSDVQVVGNKNLSDQELLNLIILKAGDPIDPFLLDRGSQEIRRAYEKKGYFVTDVTIDRQALDESGILIYRVREGPRARIRDINFEGNQSFTEKQLRSRIRTNTYLLILRKGELSREQLDGDVARLREFYQQRGYLDAQVGRRIDLSTDQKDAVIVFFVEEGRQYTVDEIRIEGNQVFSSDQIRLAMTLRPGDIYSDDERKRTKESLDNLYGKLGYIESLITVERLFHETDPKVDLIVTVAEGVSATAGKITIRGNELTKDKVVLQQIRGIQPGRPIDRAGIAKTEQRLSESALFSEATISVLGEAEQTQRDVLVEVKERNTGSVSFGAGLSSDVGLLGAVDVVQRNFDIADFPESPGEFFLGRAFRGAGQYFSINLQPGVETSRYSISFREPYLFDTNLFFDSNVFYFSRDRDRYDEERVGGNFGIGQRFGDVWSLSLRTRAEGVTISDIDPNLAPVDVFAVEGYNTVTALGPVLTRNTTDSRIFPTRGSIAEIGLNRIGALGGDYNFTTLTTEYRKFWTVDEDFFGRRTVLSLRFETGYIFERDEAPLFERYYAGGHRTFRGFEFRGVGPRGILPAGGPSDVPVGDRWLFLLGLEYNIPIYQDVVRWVFFLDTGTLDDVITFAKYRVSAGTGIRLKVPFLGQAPFAFDIAFPIIREDTDEEQFFSFDLAIPF